MGTCNPSYNSTHNLLKGLWGLRGLLSTVIIVRKVWGFGDCGFGFRV